VLEQIDVGLHALNFLERRSLFVRQLGVHGRRRGRRRRRSRRVPRVAQRAVVGALLFVVKASFDSERNRTVCVACANNVGVHGAGVGLEGVAGHHEIMTQNHRRCLRRQHDRHHVCAVGVSGVGYFGQFRGRDSVRIQPIIAVRLVIARRSRHLFLDSVLWRAGLNFRSTLRLFLNARAQITGIDSVTNKNVNRQYEIIVAHINILRSMPGLEHARIIFCPESNLGGEGARLTDDLRRARMHNVYVLREDGGNEGFRTTDRSKDEMKNAVNAALNEHRVRFHPNWVCANTEQNHTPESMRKLLIEELLNYKRQLIYSKTDPYKLPTVRYTGKIGGTCDDHAIVFQLLYVCREIYRQKWSFYRSQRPIYDPEDELQVMSRRREDTINHGSSMF